MVDEELRPTAALLGVGALEDAAGGIGLAPGVDESEGLSNVGDPPPQAHRTDSNNPMSTRLNMFFTAFICQVSFIK